VIRPASIFSRLGLIALVSCGQCLSAPALQAADNQLSDPEKNAGWILLFDGKTLDGWMTSSQKPSQRPVDQASINPSLDFKISKGCNSGIFIRTFPLTPRPEKDVGFNGLEIAVDDTKESGFHDTGAIYDLVKPKQNAMRPAGEWNHIVVTSRRNLIEVELNGQQVTRMDLDEWIEKNKRPDGSGHKFDIAYKDHPREGYIGLQDHGADCWYKNIKIQPLK
jgi:hypothetical protein